MSSEIRVVSDYISWMTTSPDQVGISRYTYHHRLLRHFSIISLSLFPCPRKKWICDNFRHWRFGIQYDLYKHTCTAQTFVQAYMRCCSLVADLKGPLWAGQQCLVLPNRIYRRRYSDEQLLVAHYSRR